MMKNSVIKLNKNALGLSSVKFGLNVHTHSEYIQNKRKRLI